MTMGSTREGFDDRFGETRMDFSGSNWTKSCQISASWVSEPLVPEHMIVLKKPPFRLRPCEFTRSTEFRFIFKKTAVWSTRHSLSCHSLMPPAFRVNKCSF